MLWWGFLCGFFLVLFVFTPIKIMYCESSLQYNELRAMDFVARLYCVLLELGSNYN